MTMAQFSRDDILIYQGREEGREEVREEEQKKAREWLTLGIRNMAETYVKFKQPREAAKEAILEKYPDADEIFIDSIIVKAYGE